MSSRSSPPVPQSVPRPDRSRLAGAHHGPASSAVRRLLGGAWEHLPSDDAQPGGRCAPVARQGAQGAPAMGSPARGILGRSEIPFTVHADTPLVGQRGEAGQQLGRTMERERAGKADKAGQSKVG